MITITINDNGTGVYHETNGLPQEFTMVGRDLTPQREMTPVYVLERTDPTAFSRFARRRPTLMTLSLMFNEEYEPPQPEPYPPEGTVLPETAYTTSNQRAPQNLSARSLQDLFTRIEPIQPTLNQINFELAGGSVDEPEDEPEGEMITTYTGRFGRRNIEPFFIPEQED